MKKSLASRPAPSGNKVPIAEITHAQKVAALEPLMSLLGTSLDAVYADSTEIHAESIRYFSVEPIAGVEPVDLRCEGYENFPGVWAWPVSVQIAMPQDDE